MTQTGGTVFRSGFMTVGRRGATGVLNFSGGSITTGQDLNIGDGENDAVTGEPVSSPTATTQPSPPPARLTAPPP